MSGDCSFNEHINLRTKQCRQLTGWILRTFKSRDKCTMVALFKSLVLPRLEYGCQLWSPTSVKQINAIENIRRKFTKHITGMHSLQGWGQVQLTKYSSTPSTPNIYQVQVLVKYSFFKKVLKYIKYKYKYSLKFVLKSGWTYRAE